MSSGAVGVDQALGRTGVATSVGTHSVRGLPASCRDIERIRFTTQAVAGAVRESEPRLVAIEGQFSSPNASGRLLVGLHWAIRYELERIEVPVLVVTNQQVKIFATGSATTAKRPGESSDQRRRRFKREIVAQLTVRTQRTYPNDDEAEAEILRCIALEFLGLPHPMGRLPHSHRRAIEPLELA